MCVVVSVCVCFEFRAVFLALELRALHISMSKYIILCMHVCMQVCACVPCVSPHDMGNEPPY